MADNQYMQITGEKGVIHISENVITAITSAALSEVEGIAGCGNTAGAELYEFLGRKPSSKGIRVDMDGDCLVLNLTVMVKYGFGIAKAAAEAQKAVFSALESMAGLTPEVNVSVTGVAFEKQGR